ncbi:MAG TPA: helix-turn-helix domain-containing protein [Acidimicrobiales bacterium]|nr:helix-turn-helix domain-containing protein [Acidimicrobiales bacterium]
MVATRSELLAELTAAGLSGRTLRGREVAVLFQVSERTVLDWSRRGRLATVFDPRGIRRYPAEAVRDLLRDAGEGSLSL